MKKQDLVWIGALMAIILFLVNPTTHGIFMAATKNHPYIMGFVKFSILSTMGELLALRIVNGGWKKPVGVVYRAIIWGILGMTFVLVFELFSSGVASAMKKSLLPSFGQGLSASIAAAFFTSALMNFLFAPTFMAFHRITDTYIDLGEGDLAKICKVQLKDVVKKIDWVGYIDFVVCKTLPIFWVPAHTITFLLPPEYRVLMAAFLSIALGGILAFAKKKSAKA